MKFYLVFISFGFLFIKATCIENDFEATACIGLEARNCKERSLYCRNIVYKLNIYGAEKHRVFDQCATLLGLRVTSESIYGHFAHLAKTNEHGQRGIVGAYIRSLSAQNPEVAKELKKCLLFKDMAAEGGVITKANVEARFASFIPENEEHARSLARLAFERCIAPTTYQMMDEYLKCIGRVCITDMRSEMPALA